MTYIFFTNPVRSANHQIIPSQIVPFNINMKSLFSDNSKVYYKKGSLTTSGAGSVRNSSIKSKRI
jgi:hypothetical protein